MAIRDPRLIVLLDEVWRRFEDAQGDEHKTLNVVSEVRKALGMTGSDLVAQMEAKGYIQKSAAKSDPPEGELRRLPLASALREVSVQMVEANPVSGLLLRCLRCGSMWRVEGGYEGGDPLRPSNRNFWKCPQGCNASATWRWDGGRPPSYNPMSGYQ